MTPKLWRNEVREAIRNLGCHFLGFLWCNDLSLLLSVGLLHFCFFSSPATDISLKLHELGQTCHLPTLAALISDTGQTLIFNTISTCWREKIWFGQKWWQQWWSILPNQECKYLLSHFLKIALARLPWEQLAALRWPCPHGHSSFRPRWARCPSSGSWNKKEERAEP